ncbi:MAG: hypothetical protein V4857_14130 [Pseudomonadota bacterium]
MVALLYLLLVLEHEFRRVKEARRRRRIDAAMVAPINEFIEFHRRAEKT